MNNSDIMFFCAASAFGIGVQVFLIVYCYVHCDCFSVVCCMVLCLDAFFLSYWVII